jgi:hypothetical protein
MKREKTQELLEEKTHDIIDEIAEELGVEVSQYPEVFWIGRANYEEPILSKSDLQDFHYIKRTKESAYLCSPKIILIGKNHPIHLSEEAGHFLHFTNSKINYENKSQIDVFSLSVIVEMFGYFCSKLIYPERKIENEEIKGDCLHYNLKDPKKFIFHLNHLLSEDSNISEEFLMYQQGYSLGEKLFQNYLSGRMPKVKIKEIFTNPMKSPTEPTIYFYALKKFLNGIRD